MDNKYGENLTEDQYKALELLDEFYNSDKKQFLLFGPAGSGKTYVLNRFIKYINNKPCAASAPTHKAVRVIENQLNADGNNNIKGITIQSLHGLRPNVNIQTFDIDKLQFSLLGKPKIGSYSTVLIDECGMVPDSIVKLNIKAVNKYNTKIIYIGDKYQLTPVNSNLISSSFLVEDFAELKTIVRQDESHTVRPLLLSLQNDIDNNGSKFINYLYNTKSNVVNDKGFILHNKKSFVSTVIDEFKESIKDDIRDTKVLAWTNLYVLLHNRMIRKHVIMDEKNIITDRDVLTAYETIVDEFYKPTIVNSDDYYVVRTYKRRMTEGFDVFVCDVVNASTAEKTTIKIVDHHSTTWYSYYDILNKLHHDAINANYRNRGKMFKKYYQFKTNYLSLIKFPLVNDKSTINKFVIYKRYEIVNGYKPYEDMSNTELLQFFPQRFGVRAWVNKDLDYAYALTVHKSQGSTYKNIYLDMLDISTYNHNTTRFIRNTSNRPDAIDTRNRLLYTGLTRVTNIANILI